MHSRILHLEKGLGIQLLFFKKHGISITEQRNDRLAHGAACLRRHGCEGIERRLVEDERVRWPVMRRTGTAGIYIMRGGSIVWYGAGREEASGLE